MEKVAYEGGCISRSPYVCSPPTLSLICWLTNSDVSVSALRARSMADTVFAETVAVIEELVVSRPDNKASPSSAAAEESPVVSLATLESVSFSHGKNVKGIEATQFRLGLRGGASTETDVCRLGILFASPRQG